MWSWRTSALIGTLLVGSWLYACDGRAASHDGSSSAFGQAVLDGRRPSNPVVPVAPVALDPPVAARKATANCMNVLGTRRGQDARAELQMTLGDAPFDVALDGSAIYPKSPVWDAGAAPSVCGAILSGGHILLVVQLHQRGQPVVRLQWMGLSAGTQDLSKTMTTGMVVREGQPKAAALRFTAGELTTSEDDDGKVSVTFVDAAGTTMGPDPVPFTLAGSLKATLRSR